MTYHPDLTTAPNETKRYVGWLDCKHPFTTGGVDTCFVTNLAKIYGRRVRQTRGFHICDSCEEAHFRIRVAVGEEVLTLGSAEIEVTGDDGQVYVAPDLIYHYVVSHRYLPPPEFIAAVSSQA